MTHTPPESKAWPHAGAADRPSASGEQLGRREPGASDLPSAASDDAMDGMTAPFPEAGRHEGNPPDRGTGRAQAKDAERQGSQESGRTAAGGPQAERT